MRLSDDDFAALSRVSDFESYYEQLSPAEMMEEVERLHTDGSKQTVLFQHIMMHRRFLDIACFNRDLADHQRSAVIGVVNGLRESIDRIILPAIDSAMAERVQAALASSEDYVERFGSYPRAAAMIRIGARKPVGPYELGVIEEIFGTQSN